MKRKKGIIVLAVAVCCAVCLAVGCSPKEPTPVQPSGGGSTEPAAFAWSPDTDCSVCHAKSEDSFADASCLAATHVSMKDNCTFCHTDTAKLAEIHANADSDTSFVKRLYFTVVEEKVCLGCHDAKDVLAAKTADSTVLTDRNGTVMNPHAVPSNDYHDTITCGDCHLMHSAGTAKDEALSFCYDCHHGQVFECGTCHEIRKK